MSDFHSYDAPSSAAPFPEPTQGQVPAAPTSPLAGLRKQRAEIAKSLYVDMQVPRYEDPVIVRYRAPSKSDILRIQTLAKKSKDPEFFAEAHLLAAAVVGVYQRDEKGEPIGGPDDWPKFDHELAEALGEPDLVRAVDVVRALFFTDGDIVAHSTALSEWAGYAQQQVVEEHQGN